MFLLTIFGLFMAIVANMSGVEGGVISFLFSFSFFNYHLRKLRSEHGNYGLRARAGSLAYARQRRIDFRLGGVLLIATLPGRFLAPC